MDNNRRWTLAWRSPTGKFKKRYTFLDGAASDHEKVLAIGLREATVSLGNVRCDRKRCEVQLVEEKTVATRELLGGGANLIGEIDRLLVDEELFEMGSQLAAPSEESRPSRGEKAESL